ncbi:hypothetical protein NQZ68_005373 [Dissostichus eleginoides]|nr:hypothetical protein NQZ68_005373 [Dissostichus eleginoides]
MEVDGEKLNHCRIQLTFSTCTCHEQMKGNVNVCRWRVWGATGFPSCSASLRNRAGESRGPWDVGTGLRKELLCSHLNRGRCWRRREVGQTEEREGSQRAQQAMIGTQRCTWVGSKACNGSDYQAIVLLFANKN